MIPDRCRTELSFDLDEPFYSVNQGVRISFIKEEARRCFSLPLCLLGIRNNGF